MKIDIVSDIGGDWIGIYVDEKLAYEGHSVPVCIWIDLLEQATENEIVWETDWVGEDYGRLPPTLEEATKQIKGE